MEKLRRFTNTIRDIKQNMNQIENSKIIHYEEVVVDDSYHGQVLEEDEHMIDSKVEIQEMKSWFVGKLKCKKHIDDKYRDQINMSGSDGRNIDDYSIIDPRK